MSHFVEVKTVYKDQAELISALESAFGAGTVEIHPEGAALYGYHGDNRADLNPRSPDYAPPCHVIIKQWYIGTASNDIGYRRSADGTFTAYVSSFDKRFAAQKLALIPQAYAVNVAVKQAKAKGWQVQQTRVDGNVKLTLSKWGT